jgi:hypothetical protein
LKNNQSATQFSNKTVKIWSTSLTQSYFIDLSISSRTTRVTSMIETDQLLLISTCDSKMLGSSITIYDLNNQNKTTPAAIRTNGCVN